MVGGWQALLPDAVIRLAPGDLHAVDDGLDQVDQARRQLGPLRLERGGEVDERAEHVELHLRFGGVADAHRPAAGVAGEVLERGLHCVMTEDGVQGPEAVGAADLLHPLADPVEVRHPFAERTEAGEARRGQRRVAQPAEAVVPVAGATEVLGQARGGGGADRAGRFIGEGPQGERRALDHLAEADGQGEFARPRPPLVPLRRGRVGGVFQVGAEDELHRGAVDELDRGHRG